MKQSLWQESFVPVMLVVLAIFVSLLFVQYEASQDAERAIVIVIEESGTDIDAPDGEEDVAILPSVNDPERARILKLMDNRHWAEAEQALKRRLAEKAASETLADLGTLYYRQGDYEQALQYLNRAIAMQPVYVSAYFQRGLVFSKKGEPEKAMADYRKQIKLEPFHFEANYNLGVLQLQAKQYRLASQTFAQAAGLVSGKRKAKTYYNLGLAFRQLGADGKAQARQAFNAAIRLRPDYIAPRFALAALEPDNREGWQHALRLYETVLRLRPSYAPAYFRMGLAHSALGHTKSAIDAYRQAIKHDPAYVKAHFNLGLKLITARQWTEAGQQFEWMLERDPKHAKSHFNLGRIANAKKDYAAALEHYQTAISLRQGDYPAAMVNMGLIHFEQHQYDQAIAAYNDAIRHRPDYAEAWYRLGLTQLQKGMAPEAKTSLQTAIRSNPDFHQAWAALGNIHSQEEHLDDAAHAYQQALRIRPDYQPAQLALADIYHQQQRDAEAASLYKVLLESYPAYGVAWRKLGGVYEAMGRHAEAEISLRKALQLNPQDIESRRALAKLMLAQRQYREAVELLASAVEAESARPELYLEYAEALIAAGNTGAARAELEKGLRLDPENRKMLQAIKSLEK